MHATSSERPKKAARRWRLIGTRVQRDCISYTKEYNCQELRTLQTNLNIEFYDIGLSAG